MLGVGLFNNPNKYIGSWNFGPDNDDVKSVEDIINIGKKLEVVGEAIYEKLTFAEANNLILNIDKAKLKLNFKPVWNSEKAVKINI